MPGWVQGRGKIEGCFALLGAGGIAAVISTWGPRPAATADSPPVTMQASAENTALAVNSRPSVSNLSIEYPAYRLTAEAMFGYTTITKRSRAQEVTITPHALVKSQRQGTTLHSNRLPRDASNFFNEAQLASIRARLNLTPAQLPKWTSLEAALRAIHWRRSADKEGRKDTKSLDLDEERVESLTVAATPLVMTLRADQKEEIRTLLHLMGMEKLASRF